MIGKITGIIVGAVIATAGMLVWQQQEPVPQAPVSAQISDQGVAPDPQPPGDPVADGPGSDAGQAVDLSGGQAWAMLPAGPESQGDAGAPRVQGKDSLASAPGPAAREEAGPRPQPGQDAAKVAAADLETRWQDVWKPFYSEESARGFARGLERVSGVELHVRKVAAGRYQVAFAHGSEAEREVMLRRLSQASGLDLQGGGS